MKGKTEERNRQAHGGGLFLDFRVMTRSISFLRERPVGPVQMVKALGTMGSMPGELLSCLPGAARQTVG